MKNTNEAIPQTFKATRLTHQYSLVALLAVVIAGLLLTFIYRNLTVNNLIQMGERNNIHLGRIGMNVMHSELIDFLESAKNITPGIEASLPISQNLKKNIVNFMTDAPVVRLKIFNLQGVIVFSTQPDQIGTLKKENQGYLAAMKGEITSKILYRGTLSFLDHEKSKNNLIQSYLPIRNDEASPIIGVLEIYTDVDPLVNQTERVGLFLLIGIWGTLGTVYIVLFILVQRSNTVIQKQQTTILNRTRALEGLSSQLLTTQEIERQQFSADLHEGIAQTLAAIKFKLESIISHPNIDLVSLKSQAGEQLVPMLQNAIKQVKDMAISLRPPSLDHLGLIDTLDEMKSQYQQMYPTMKVVFELNIDEEKIPQPLKVVVYRMIQESLRVTAEEERATEIHINLSRHNNRLDLKIEDNALRYHPATSSWRQGTVRGLEIASLRERALLSGGDFTVKSNQLGGTVCCSSWTLQK